MQKILVVDDTEYLAKSIERHLNLRGYRASVAYNVPQAKEKIDAEGPFDLVISDYSMPGENGVALADWIRQHHPTLRVIMNSGTGEETIGRENPSYRALRNAGTIIAYVYKGHDEFMEAIEQAVGKPEITHERPSGGMAMGGGR